MAFARLKILARPLAPLAGVLIVTTLLAGCGSGTLSHHDLVAKANTACARADAAVSKLGVPTSSLAALTHYAGQVLPISQKLARQLSALKPGSSDTAAFNRLVTAVQNGNHGLMLMAKATSTVQTGTAGQIIVAKSVPQAASALGAGTCATSPSA